MQAVPGTGVVERMNTFYLQSPQIFSQSARIVLFATPAIAGVCDHPLHCIICMAIRISLQYRMNPLACQFGRHNQHANLFRRGNR
jgi:hypothetical protein